MPEVGTQNTSILCAVVDGSSLYTYRNETSVRTTPLKDTDDDCNSLFEDLAAPHDTQSGVDCLTALATAAWRFNSISATMLTLFSGAPPSRNSDSFLVYLKLQRPDTRGHPCIHSVAALSMICKSAHLTPHVRHTRVAQHCLPYDLCNTKRKILRNTKGCLCGEATF